MSRPARAEIDLAALRANYDLARSVHGGQVVAVLKANAYGHGAVPCARTLDGTADAFGVAFVEEAVALRAGGIASPILVLEGAFDSDDLAAAVRHDLWLVVHQESQVRQLESLPADRRLAVWLKIDSGMHRAGVSSADARVLWERLRKCRSVAGVTWMSHLASADELDSEATAHQLTLFERTTVNLPGARSVANSAGLLGWSQARADWGRAGLMLYGADPLGGQTKALRPVMTLKSQVFAQRWVEAGEAVGYGGSFVAERRTRVGLVAMGYADGYPRSAPTGTPVAVDGMLTRIIGRVSMDMLTVDLTGLTNAGIGSEVELWGSRVSVDTVAKAAATIPYELLCNVKRVEFSYSDR